MYNLSESFATSLGPTDDKNNQNAECSRFLGHSVCLPSDLPSVTNCRSIRCVVVADLKTMWSLWWTSMMVLVTSQLFNLTVAKKVKHVDYSGYDQDHIVT